MNTDRANEYLAAAYQRDVDCQLGYQDRPALQFIPLDRLSATLAAYRPLNCGIVHIGPAWLVFLDGKIQHGNAFSTRTDAIMALAELDRAERKRAIEGAQAQERG